MSIKPDRIRSAGAIGFGLPSDPPGHWPDFADRHESGLPICKRCGLPVSGEQWAGEPCPGRPI